MTIFRFGGELLDSYIGDSFFTVLAVGAPEAGGTDGAEIRCARGILFIEDVRVKHRSEQEGNRGFNIEVRQQLTARDTAAKNLLDALARRFGDAVSPFLAEFRMEG